MLIVESNIFSLFSMVALFLIPVFLWPRLDTYCERCGKVIGNWLVLSEDIFCKECKPFLTEEEHEKEKWHAGIIKELLKLNGGERLVLPWHIRKELKGG